MVPYADDQKISILYVTDHKHRQWSVLIWRSETHRLTRSHWRQINPLLTAHSANWLLGSRYIVQLASNPTGTSSGWRIYLFRAHTLQQNETTTNTHMRARISQCNVTVSHCVETKKLWNASTKLLNVVSETNMIHHNRKTISLRWYAISTPSHPWCPVENVLSSLDARFRRCIAPKTWTVLHHMSTQSATNVSPYATASTNVVFCPLEDLESTRINTAAQHDGRPKKRQRQRMYQHIRLVVS